MQIFDEAAIYRSHGLEKPDHSVSKSDALDLARMVVEIEQLSYRTAAEIPKTATAELFLIANNLGRIAEIVDRYAERGEPSKEASLTMY